MNDDRSMIKFPGSLGAQLAARHDAPSGTPDMIKDRAAR